MVTIVHVMADGTVKNDITGTEVPKEICKQLYRIITEREEKKK